MIEDFNKLYDQIYAENFNELEKYRKASVRMTLLVLFYILLFILIALALNVFYAVVFVFCIITFSLIKYFNDKKNNTLNKYTQGNAYQIYFKKNVIKPLVQSINENTIYEADSGISEDEYMKSEFERNFDRYYSEDKITTQIFDESTAMSKTMVFSEVLTQRESKDSEGHTNVTTSFSGVMGYVDVGKKSNSFIKIATNGSFMFQNNRIKMDMSEFEKHFDVSTDNQIETMQVLTSDIMAYLVDFTDINKTKVEINIINSIMYIRFSTGSIFEPSVFGQSMKKDLILKYYNIIKFCMEFGTKMSKVISEANI